jgi:hypothetical protein
MADKTRDFPGTSSDYITKVTPTGLTMDAAWTCMMWVKPDTASSCGILRIGTADNGPTRGVILGLSSGVPYIRQSSNGFSGGSALSTTLWSRVGYRKDASGLFGTLRTTVNGVDVASSTLDPASDLIGGDEFRASQAVAGIGFSNFAGQLAWVAWVQGVSLSAASQDAYLNNPQSLVNDYGPNGTVSANALKLLWSMQCDAETEVDLSGVGNTGARNGTVTLEITGPDVTTPWSVCGTPPRIKFGSAGNSRMTVSPNSSNGSRITITR